MATHGKYQSKRYPGTYDSNPPSSPRDSKPQQRIEFTAIETSFSIVHHRARYTIISFPLNFLKNQSTRVSSAVPTQSISPDHLEFCKLLFVVSFTHWNSKISHTLKNLKVRSDFEILKGWKTKRRKHIKNCKRQKSLWRILSGRQLCFCNALFLQTAPQTSGRKMTKWTSLLHLKKIFFR